MNHERHGGSWKHGEQGGKHGTETVFVVEKHQQRQVSKTGKKGVSCVWYEHTQGIFRNRRNLSSRRFTRCNSWEFTYFAVIDHLISNSCDQEKTQEMACCKHENRLGFLPVRVFCISLSQIFWPQTLVKRIFRKGPCCNENKLGFFTCRRTDSDSRSIILIPKSSSTSTHCHRKTGSLSACSGTCDWQTVKLC